MITWMKPGIVGVFLMVLVSVAAATDTFTTAFKRDENSSTTITDKRETRAAQFLRDKALFGRAYGQDYGRIHVLMRSVQAFRALGSARDDEIALLYDCGAPITNVTLPELIQKYGEPDSRVNLPLDGAQNGTALFWGSACLVTVSNTTIVGYGMPVVWLVESKRVGNTIHTESGPGTDLLTFLQTPPVSEVPGVSEARTESSPTNAFALLPPFARPLVDGDNSIVVDNPNSISLSVGIRQGERGANMMVLPNSNGVVRVSNGKYDFFVVYSDKPSALLQGDSLLVDGHAVTIRVTETAVGNYRIRQVR